MRTLAILAVLAGGVWWYGTPYLRIEYVCHGGPGDCNSYSRCQYLGAEGWRYHPGPDCGILRLFPLQWKPFA